MSLVFAAITPHPPLIIPAIGKEMTKKVAQTEKAFTQLEEDLYLSRPETLIIISPHGSYFKDSFTVNGCPEYETDLREFGDLTTKLKFKGDMQFASKLRQKTKGGNFPAVMISEKFIDHGTAVPLYFLLRHLPALPILPLGFCALDWKTHLDFGYLLKDQIMNANKRIAVIASGDLSHALANDAPAGFAPEGEKFDAKIQELLSSRNTAGMLNLDPGLVERAAECGFRSFLILMGVLRGVNYTYKHLSYEAPFGVGYLTANFVI